MGVRSARQRSDRGASAVEFAMVVPFLMLILLGMVTTGFAYSDHLAVTNAVREGARFGAALDYTASGQWADSVRDRVSQVYFERGVNLDTKYICVKLVDATTAHATISGTYQTASTGGTDCGTAPSLTGFSNMASNSCAVVVWVHKPETIQLVIAPSLSFNMGAQSIAYYGRQAGLCTAK